MHSFWHFYIRTFKDIKKHSAIFTTLVLGAILYGFFYPTAYKAQQAQYIPIIIVDELQSPLSQNIIQNLSANTDIQIKSITPNFFTAKAQVTNEEAEGILLLSDQGIGLYLSAAYLLRTNQAQKGIIASLQGLLPNTITLHERPLFNTLSGYGSYIFPAVAPLIIHQTILLAVGMLVGIYRQKPKWKPSCAEFWGIYSAIFSISWLNCLYLFGFVFWLYDYPRGGNFWAMMMATPIFLCAVLGFGFFLSTWFDRPERAGQLLVGTSIPLFLLSGLSWPHQAMPILLQYFAWLLPSTSGIQMFIQINQMGASLLDIWPKLLFLTIFAFLFTAMAYKRLKVS